MNQTGLGALLPLLLVLTSGWLLLRSRYCQPLIWWQSGYNLYFRIAFAGIVCLVPGLIVAALLIRFGLMESSCVNGDANVAISFRNILFFQSNVSGKFCSPPLGWRCCSGPLFGALTNFCLR